MVSPLLPEGVILSATSGLMFCDWITQKIQFKDSFYFSLKKKKADKGENPTRVFMGKQTNSSQVEPERGQD